MAFPRFFLWRCRLVIAGIKVDSKLHRWYGIEGVLLEAHNQESIDFFEKGPAAVAPRKVVHAELQR